MSAHQDFNEPLFWNTSSVTTFEGIFLRAESFNQDISSWDVPDMVTGRAFFRGAKRFDQSLTAWNVSKLQSLEGMFAECDRFNQDLSSWKIDSACYLSSGFAHVLAFDRDMNAWGQQLQGRTCVSDKGQVHVPKVASMFQGSSCPVIGRHPKRGSFCRRELNAAE